MLGFDLLMRSIPVIWAFFCATAFSAPESDFEFFESRVRPVLIEKCYECHGQEKQKGGLRLDSRGHVLKGGDLGPVIVPGKPEESLLIKAISWLDPDLQMPPKNRLKPQETAALIEWVKRGAPDPRMDSPAPPPQDDPLEKGKTHWAYQPLALPELSGGASASAIDQLINRRLDDEKLVPAPKADRITLLRRIHYDLTGLPPSPDEIAEFQNSSVTVAEVVDRLLGSPHFGEHWGRHWLDVARYAESVTLRGLVFREAWRYRDYVIDSFNRDLPFSEFIKEQVSGDLLERTTLEDRHRALTATTFLVLGNYNYEEQDKEQLRMDIVDEQLDTIGKAFLGQTLGCARCHDHKFDPIPASDYYAMAGILRSTASVKHANVSSWLDLPLPMTPEESDRVEKHEREMAELQRKIRKASEALSKLAGGTASEAVTSVENLPGIVIDDIQAKKVGAWTLSQFNKPYIGEGYLHDQNSEKGSKTLTFLPDLIHSGTYEVRLAYTHGENRASKASITILHAAGESMVEVNQRVAPPIDRHFASLGKYYFEKGNQGYVLVFNADAVGHVVADAVQFLPIDGAPAVASLAPVQTDAAALTKAELDALRKELAELSKNGPGRPMVMSVQEEEKPEDTHIHIRGSVHTLGAKVPRGFLRFGSEREFAPISTQESGRRELAQWLSDPENPLTSRVMVNRIWLWLMGSGIVRTPDNFGTTGDAPSHPELLDYLAARFIDGGWSVKKIIREIMLSDVYQRSSLAPEMVLKSDPENRLFARTNRRRLPAEAMRDTILHASGQLDLAAGGSTIKSSTNADFGYQDQSRRRSVYIPAFRNALPELFELFDFADPSMVTGQRNRSTVAPQSLYFLNHPFILEQSRLTAERLLEIGNLSNEDRIRRMYLLILQRHPTSPEEQVALTHLASPGNNLPPLEKWTELCHALFASADFRFVY